MKKYILNQIINNQLISKISLYSSSQDIEALKSFILLPSKDELVKEFNFIKIQLQAEDGLKMYLNFALDKKKNENDIYSFFQSRNFNNIAPKKIIILLMQTNTWSYENYIRSIEKGELYEKYIFSLLKYKGYNIIHNCLELGKADKGIDFIGIKNDVAILIQCKNFENTEITHLHLKEFYANCKLYLLENPLDGFKKRFLYLASYDFLSDSARYFLKENSFIEFSVLKYKNSATIVP